MRERLIDLMLLFEAEDGLPTRTGEAIVECTALPHPILRMIEELYATDVAKARFQALWSQRGCAQPDLHTLGLRFMNEVIEAFRRRGKLLEPSTLVIDEQHPVD